MSLGSTRGHMTTRMSCELGADVGQLLGQGALRGVDLVGATQQRIAFGLEAGTLLGSTRQAAVAHGVASGDDVHGDFPPGGAVRLRGERIEQGGSCAGRA